jgi:hypothetical protein
VNVSDLTEKQRSALRHLNEKAAGPALVPSAIAAPLRRAGLVEPAGTGQRGKALVRLTEAGLRAANELVGGSAA